MSEVNTPLLLATVHALAASAMVGILWIVQLVVYPAFAMVPSDGLRAYATEHARRITPVVGPLMLVEGAAFVGLAAMRVQVPVWLIIAGGVTLVVNWVSTFAWQVPLHGRIQRGDAAAIERLVRSNWLRTMCWTLRAVIAAMIVIAVASD
jgi:hypothetical protein